jgi:putative oxidoreductase
VRAEGPNPGLGLAVVRVVVGVTFVAHGAPKLFRGGVADLAAMLADLGVPLPEAAAWLVSLLEFGGGLALLVGLLVTPAALLLSAHMAAGIVLVHAPAGWHVVGPLAEHPPGGVELNVVLLAALLALVLAGPGTAAVDARRRSSGLRTTAPDDAGDGGGG